MLLVQFSHGQAELASFSGLNEELFHIACLVVCKTECASSSELDLFDLSTRTPRSQGLMVSEILWQQRHGLPIRVSGCALHDKLRQQLPIEGTATCMYMPF